MAFFGWLLRFCYLIYFVILILFLQRLSSYWFIWSLFDWRGLIPCLWCHIHVKVAIIIVHKVYGCVACNLLLPFRFSLRLSFRFALFTRLFHLLVRVARFLNQPGIASWCADRVWSYCKLVGLAFDWLFLRFCILLGNFGKAFVVFDCLWCGRCTNCF